MLWGRTGQKGFPRERLGRRPAVLGFYAWQYSGCPMKAGNLSESEGSDAFWVPLYSSIYLRESHVQGNRFDLENPGQVLRRGGHLHVHWPQGGPRADDQMEALGNMMPKRDLGCCGAYVAVRFLARETAEVTCPGCKRKMRRTGMNLSRP